jgi:2-dehydropantoate 2-reductase
MKVVVVGSGAMGTIFGLAMARSGDDVLFYDVRPDLIAAIEQDGLRLEGVLGAFHSRLSATLKPEQLGAVECALVMVDANSTPEAAKVVASCLSSQGFALSLQNGIGNVEALGEALGLERVVAGSTYNSGATLGLARVVHSNAGPTWIGEAVGGNSERVCDLARKMTAAGLPTTVSENVMGTIWSKFVHNCAINAVSAITGLRPGEIARNSSTAWIIEALLDEILAVVDRAGIDLPEHDPRAELYDHAWERYNKPSMLQHLEAGRATEIEALNGALVKKAKSLGIATPVNATIAAVVRGIEAQRQMRSNNTILEEAVMEALARSNPRAGRWDTKT